MRVSIAGKTGIQDARIQKAALVVTGVGVLTAGAWMSVPFYPVPLTMQTLAVLLVGGLLGPTLGVSAVAGYLALGLMGAPVFHGGLGGLALLAGPTGGYLLGFLPAAFLMGWATRWAGVVGSPAGFAKRRPQGVGLRQRGAQIRSLAVLVAGALLAGVAIYALGLPWLAATTGLGLSGALAAGFVPFLLGDLLKTAVAIAAVRTGTSALCSRGWLPF